MGLIASASNDFKLPPAGTQVARCYRVIDLGTHYNEMYDNRQHKIMISWELLDSVRMDDGQPFSVHKFYTLSLSDKSNLRKDLEGWRSRAFSAEEAKGFDLSNLLDKFCYISVVHEEKNGKERANVSSVMALPSTVERPAGVNESVFFSIENFDSKVFESLSDNLKKMIEESDEYKTRMNETQVQQGQQSQDFDDDIPF